MNDSEASARRVRTAHAELTARFQSVGGLRWPLTSRGHEALYALIRRTLADAETYLDDGKAAAARQCVAVGNSTLTALSALHDLETMEF